MPVDFMLEQKGRMFEGRGSLESLWQTIGEMFYPQRADFTTTRWIGQELVNDLASGFPIYVHRELTNAIGGMLRPTNKGWMHARVNEWDKTTSEERAWLNMADERQRRAMYRRQTNFTRATKEADADYAAFGQAVLQVSLNSKGDDLLYRCWHLRDVAWQEDADGFIGTIYRKWYSATVADILTLFPRTAHRNIRETWEKSPFSKVKILHCIIPVEQYQQAGGDKKFNQRFVSVYLDETNKSILEEVPMDEHEYVIPRWQTVSGSQYAYSPAVVVGLPDARTLQEMTFTLLEAGEKAVTPPLLGVQGALRSDINVMAGGLTWVDREYDERLGEVLRPLTVDKSGIPLGMDMQQDIKSQLMDAFYLNKLNLPPVGGPEMTAYEVGQRVQEFIRTNLPLFEPVEMDYNAPLAEKTFSKLMRAGVFGSLFDMPRSLQGRDVEFVFESPLHDAIDKMKQQQFLEATALLANAAGADPASSHIMDVPKAARDSLHGSGTPPEWLRSEAEVAARMEADAEAQQAALMLEQMQKGADIAKTVGTTDAPAGTGNTGAAI